MLFAIVTLLAQAAAPTPNPTPSPAPGAPVEINTVIALNTFRLQGPSKRPNVTTAAGSGFVVGRPCENDPSLYAYTLVTAAHVMHDFVGTHMDMIQRRHKPDDTWAPVRVPIQIRNESGDLWVQHKTADVAALYISYTTEDAVPPVLVPASVLATDEMLKKYEVHIGDEVLALGFPHGIGANDVVFPILRSGRIASFPLTPQARTKAFLVDMQIFPGNSGGPVYLWDRGRGYENAFHVEEIGFLMGLVTDQICAPSNPTQTGCPTIPDGRELQVAEVVHANFILETIAMLPTRVCRRTN